MERLRSIPRFVRLLVGLFLLAQLAGVVSSPRANAQSILDATAEHSHQHHGHHHDDSGIAHHQHGDHGNFRRQLLRPACLFRRGDAAAWSR